jgi:hypothetical protein
MRASEAFVTMLCPDASPVRNAKRTKSRLPTTSGCASSSCAWRLPAETTSCSSGRRCWMVRAAASAPTAPSATKSTERVMRSPMTTVRMPPGISREMLAPRPTEGHSGVS